LTNKLFNPNSSFELVEADYPKHSINFDMKTIKSLGTIILILILLKFDVYAQSFNTDPKLTYISHNIPKSPESSSFEKYGSIPVGEYTGIPNIVVPLFNISGKDVDVPINLSYHASGIKVSQEATWVGLGWDLVPGGRITLEVKGGYDKLANQYFANQVDRNIITYLFGIGNEGNPYTSPTTGVNRVFSAEFSALYSIPAYLGIQYGANLPTNQGFDRILDFYAPFIKNAVEQGVGEPDIYHVNVLNKTFDFYKDLLTDQIVVKGETNLYQVIELSDSPSNCWAIKDDNGITYYFQQQEQTHYMSYIAGLYPSTTTSWLLTKIVMPNGDEVNYTYNNYGDMVTAPTISESESVIYGETLSLGVTANTQRSNINSTNDLQYIKPQYLTKIESKTHRIDFTLGYRNDIGGLGARKLDKIEVHNKLTNDLLRTVQFNYSYTGAETTNGYYFNLTLLDFPSQNGTTVQERLKWRLNLDSVNIKGSDLANVQTYRFIYNQNVLPSKVSISQDHWGYYNGLNQVHNGGSSNVSFTPSINALITEGIIPNALATGVFTSSIGNPAYFTSPNLISTGLGGHANRTANEQLAQAGTLTSIIYPTGGWTNFEYELHRSTIVNEIIGGGLRIKKIANFTGVNEVADITTYEYKNESGGTSGTYLGSLDYLQLKNLIDEKAVETAPGNYSIQYAYSSQVTLFSNGDLSSGGPVVGYRRVTKTQHNYLDGTTNGKVIKYFNANDPERVPLTIMGIPNHQDFPTGSSHLPPIAKNDLDGQLVKEEYYDNNEVLLKKIENHYTQHNSLDTIYSLRITDNKLRQEPMSSNVFYIPIYYFEPVRSYRTTLDSSIVTQYENGAPMVTKLSYLYNNFYQKETSIVTNSDGGATIEYISTPLTYTTLPALPGIGSLVGNALGVQTLRIKNILNVPVEHVVFKRKANLDEFASLGSYNVYDEDSNIKQTYLLESTSPIPYIQFQKSSYNSSLTGYDIYKDIHYQLKQSATYYTPTNDLKQLIENGLSTSFIVDTTNTTVLATAANALHGDIAFASFENNHTGNWILYGGSSNSSSAHTGTKSYNLTTGNTISRTITTGGNYIVSYWINSGSITVNSASTSAQQTINGWTYYEHIVNLSANGTVTVEGSGTIDELRLYPKESSFTSFTYEPLTGMSSMSDSKSLTTYYEFDAFQRLKSIKNQDRDLVKAYKYNYNPNISSITPTQIYLNEAVTVNVPKACPSGQNGSLVPYTVPANKYYSFTSQSAANLLAQNEINANAQNNANTLGTCTTPPPRPTFSLYYSISAPIYFREFQIAVTDTVTSQTDYYYVNSYTSGSLVDIPGGNGYIIINELNYSGNYDFHLDSSTETGVYVQFGPIPLTGYMNLYIVEL
jgi:hypothetical protein